MLSWASQTQAQTTKPGGQVVNETWTKAGNPYIVQGDLVVPSGSFLHIGAGVEVQIASGDLQASLPDTTRVAITIEGALQVNGTEAEPVHIHAQTGSSYDTWHGLVVENTATEATFSWTTFEHARYGVDTNNAALEIYACEFANNRYQGVEMDAGAAVFDRVLLRDMQNYGVRVNGGSVTMHNVIAVDNGNYGFYLPGGTVDIYNSAAHSNDTYGVSCGGATVNIVNSLITQNSSYGLYRSSGTVTVSYSDVWGNASGSFGGTVSTSNVISTNPQYVNEALGDLQLSSTSVCIDAGTAVNAPDHDFNNVIRPLDGDGINAAEIDMGPYEYVAMPICGDAQLDNGEICDDGAANGSYGFCNGNCTGPGPYCGDSNTDAEEECDDGNTTSGDGCDATCMSEGAGGSGAGGGMSGSGGQSSGQGGSASGPGGSGSGGNGAGAGGSGTTGPCVPGEQVSCACPGDTQGVQSCNAEGSGFESCSCPNGGDGGSSESESGCAFDGSRSKPAGTAALLLLACAALWRRRR